MSELLPLAIIAAGVLLLRRVRPSFDISAVTTPLEGRAAPAIIGIITALVTWWLWGTLSATPYVHDEVALVLQARIFATFRWAAPSPPLPEFFEQFGHWRWSRSRTRPVRGPTYQTSRAGARCARLSFRA